MAGEISEGPPLMLERVVASALILFARAATGVRAHWASGAPEPRSCVYFANHASHGDFVLVWRLPAAASAPRDAARRGGGLLDEGARCAAIAANASSAPC